jgi:CRISPR-associated Csx2 family protein
MAKVYLSFLGTNDYMPCTFFWDGQEAPNTRFVQEATVKFFCRGWTPEDRILIFTTREAYKKNWLDNGHTDREGKVLERQGLHVGLQRLGLQAPFRAIEIPEGKGEDEIWKIFDILFTQLQGGDQAVFDITHAFRSIPLLALVVLHYAKAMKELQLEGIYYGAFEILGSLSQARSLPLEQRRAPIFDLTSFDALLDWTLAIDRFLGAGDALPACNLAQAAIGPVLKSTKGQDLAAQTIREVANKLAAFSQAVATCRGPEISGIVTQLQGSLRRCREQQVIQPLKPLLDRIRERLTAFLGDEVMDGIQAARWCLDHNLIQQGYTILQETLISYFIRVASQDPKDHDQRLLVSQAIEIYSKGISLQKWREPASQYPDIAQTHFDLLKKQPELVKIFDKLRQNRNDLNHAGFLQNPRPAKSFGPDLKDMIDRLEKVLID